MITSQKFWDKVAPKYAKQPVKNVAAYEETLARVRAHLSKELPTDPQNVKSQHKQLAHRAKAMIRDLASISLEMAQLVVAEANEDDQNELPGWLLVEVVRDLPRLVEKR